MRGDRSLLLSLSLGLKLINVDGDVSQNPTHHLMPGKQNRTKFSLSAVRPTASNEIYWNPERNRTKSNYIEQNRMLMGSIFRQTKKVIFSCLETENLSGVEETGN